VVSFLSFYFSWVEKVDSITFCMKESAGWFFLYACLFPFVVNSVYYLFVQAITNLYIYIYILYGNIFYRIYISDETIYILIISKGLNASTSLLSF